MAPLRERRNRRHRVQRSPRKRVVLVCEECGERLMLADPLWVWLSQGTAAFECERGVVVTLASRLRDERSGTLRGRRRSA